MAAHENLMTNKPRTFYLPDLTDAQAKKLCAAMYRHFMWRPKVVWDKKGKFLTTSFSSMGRSLYPDESCDAFPNRKGKEVTIDSLRWERISDYVNGYYLAIKP